MLCSPAAAVPPGPVSARPAVQRPPVRGAALLRSLPGRRARSQACVRRGGGVKGSRGAVWYAGRGTERASWVRLVPMSAIFSEPERAPPPSREPRRAVQFPPRDFSQGGEPWSRSAARRPPPSSGCPSHSKGGRRWATRPSTSTVGRRTTSRSSLAPYAATWWTHHCSPPATTSSALRACKTGWTACRNAQRAPPSSTRGMVLVRCSRGRRSPGELPLHTSH